MSHCHTSFVPFYLCRSGDHIDSPSFPTRRSSDLSTMQTRFDLPPLLLCCDAARLLRREINERNRDLGLSEPQWRVVGEIGRATSELQSRGHLVCRLLLEKKNNCSNT